MGPGSPCQAHSGPSLTQDTDQPVQPRESSRLCRVAALTPWRPASSPGLSSVSRGVICWSSGESFRENTAQSFQAEKSDFCLEGERQDPHIWGLEETLKTYERSSRAKVTLSSESGSGGDQATFPRPQS